MFPIRDHNPSTRPAYVTYALMAVNIVIFLLMWPAYSNEQAIYDIYASWALVPASITFGEGYYTFFSSMFMHGGLMHLAGNMLFLWIYGDNLEDELGHGRYLGFYLLCGLAAGLAQYIAGPNLRIPMVGASGAIAGVMGGYVLLYPKAKIDILLILIVSFRVFPVPAWIVLGLWFGLQIFGELGSTSQGGVAYLAHIGGFAAGVILIYPLWQKLGGTRFWNRTHGMPDHPEAQYTFVRSSIPTVIRKK